MAVKFKMKPTIKALVLAPSVGGLCGFVTEVVTTAVSNLPSAVVSAAQASLYGVAIGAVVFAIILVSSMDEMVEEGQEAPTAQAKV